MTWTIDSATAPTSPFSSQANPIQHTCGATAKLLICYLFVNGNTPRAGGAPTYNGATMTDSGQGFVVETECGVEIWYLIDPDTGSAYDLTVPNTGAESIGIGAVSYIPSAGGCAYDNSTSTTGTTQNPSVAITVSAAGNLLLGALGSGDRDVPTAGTGFTLHHTSDEGNQTWGSEYDLAADGTSETVAFGTARADDWGLIGISFEEAVGNITINNISDGLTVADSATIDPLVLAGVSSSEDITVGEDATVAVQEPTPLSINVSDGLTVGESASIDPLVLADVSVSDGLTIGDSATAAVQEAVTLSISVSDNIPVNDGGPRDIWTVGTTQVGDGIIGGMPYVDIEITINQSDGLTVTDSPTVTVEELVTEDLDVNVSDGVTIGESVTIDPLLLEGIAVSDNVIVTDYLWMYDDTIAVGESATVELEGEAALAVDVSDGVTVADSTTVDPLLLGDVAVSDGVAIGEATTEDIQLNIDTSDGLTVGDTGDIAITSVTDLEVDVSDGLTVDDTTTITPLLLVDVSVSDGLTIADTSTITPLVLGDVSVSDDLAIGESTAEDIQLEITGADDLTVADSPTIDPLLLEGISQSEDVTVDDVATVVVEVEGVIYITQAEDITVADSATVDPLVINASASDDLAIGESTVEDIQLEVSASDGLTVTDSSIVSFGAIADLNVSVSDGVTVSETATGDILLEIITSDGVTVDEDTTVAIVAVSDLSVSVSDSLTVADATSLDPLLLAGVDVSDGLSVVDSVTIDIPLGISKAESITLDDSTTVTPLLIDLVAADNITVADVDTVELPGYVIYGSPDKVAYVLFRDKRAYIEFRDKRSFILYRDKRSIV